MADPKVSILVPTYNGARYVGECIASILSQTFTDFECLVHDDASTDDTLDAVRRVAGADSRVTIYRRPGNVGPQANLTGLYEAASAPLVNWVLHDDVILPDHLERLLPAFTNDKVVLATGKRTRITADGQRLTDIAPFGPLTSTPRVFDGRQLGNRVLGEAANVIGETTSVILRRGLIGGHELWRCGGHLLSTLADVWLWVQLLAQGDAYYDPTELSLFRQHGQQSTANLRGLAAGVGDWVHVIEGARRLGFLSAPRAAERAQVAIGCQAAATFAAHGGDPDAAALLDVVRLCAGLSAPLGSFEWLELWRGLDPEIGQYRMQVDVQLLLDMLDEHMKVSQWRPT